MEIRRNFVYSRFLGIQKKPFNQIADFWKRTNYVSIFNNKKRMIEHLKWKYSNEYTELACASVGRLIAGTCGIIKIPFYSKFGLLKGGWGIDSCTDPYYSKMNNFIFYRVYKMIFSFVVSGERDISMCFPTDSISSTYLKTGWKDVPCMFSFKRSLSRKGTLHLCKDPFLRSSMRDQILHKKPALKIGPGLNFKQINRFDSRIDALTGLYSDRFSLIAYRGSEFLNWRYADCPTKEYKFYVAASGDAILGYIILKETCKDDLRLGYIVDIFADPNNAPVFSYLILEAVKLFRINKIDVVSCVASYAPLHSILINSNFLIENKERLFIVSKKAKLLNGLIKEKNKWFITMGDGDFEMENN